MQVSHHTYTEEENEITIANCMKQIQKLKGANCFTVNLRMPFVALIWAFQTGFTGKGPEMRNFGHEAAVCKDRDKTVC